MKFDPIELKCLLGSKGYLRGPFGSALKRGELKSLGIPVYEQQHAITGAREFRYFIDEKKYESLKRFTVNANDLIISCSGTVGKVSVISTDDPKGIISQALLVLRPDIRKITSDFLYYFLISNQGQRELLNASQGAVQQNIAPRAVVEKIQVPTPSLDIQERIVVVLKTIDNKIQLNRRINQTFEQLAQAIFKSWFVDFEPVKAKIAVLKAGGSSEDALLAAMQAISGKDETALTRLQAEQPEQYAELSSTAELFPSAMQDSELGEIPEGWKTGTLEELIKFNPRRTLKKGSVAPYLDMKNVPTSGHLAEEVVEREMSSGTKFINGDTLLARITPCLENGKTAYVDFLEDDQVGWGSTEYIVMRPQEGFPETIGYFIARDFGFRQYAIQSMTGTSGRQRADVKALAELPWLIYPKSIAEVFGTISGFYMKLAKSHDEESRSLSQMRDIILPKLLSGELPVTFREE